MNKQAIKGKLYRYIDLTHERDQIAEQIRRLETIAYTPGTPATSGLPRKAAVSDWTHEDSRGCILGAILTERKGHFLLESDIEQWNRRDGND